MTGGVIKQPYFLLEQPQRVNDNILNSLLGLVVQDPYKPLDLAFRPREPLKARDCIDRLYPDTYVVCTDFTKVEKNAKKGKASSKLQRITALSLEKGNSNTDKLEAAVFRRISILNAHTKIKDLLSERGYQEDDDEASSLSPTGSNEQRADLGENRPTEPQSDHQTPPDADNDGFLSRLISPVIRMLAPADPVPDLRAQEAEQRARQTARKAKQEQNRVKYRDQVLQFLKDEGKLYVISSFITCSEFTKNKEKISSKSAELAAGGGPAGLPSFVEVDLAATYESTKDAGTSGAYQGEYLIACSYLPLDQLPRKRGFFESFSGPKTNDIEPYVGAHEIWRLGTGAEGNMAVLLGQNGPNSIKDEERADKEDDSRFQVCLVYRQDEADNDPYALDNSEDEMPFED